MKDMSQKTIILYYKYTNIPRPKDILIQQRSVCANLGLKGRILIAPEGINGTLEGDHAEIEEYIHYMNDHAIFDQITYKKSIVDGTAFPKLIIKTRSEIVTSYLGEEDVNPAELTGKYITAEELYELMSNKDREKDFEIVDMRNDYEQVAGMFEGSIPSGLTTFKDLKQVADNLAHLKEKKIITVCTGGVRCEKASGYLLSKGYKNVYQLKDGIVTYMEKFPNKHFKGKLYVFDNRILIGFNTNSPEHEIFAKCDKCGVPNENYINCTDDYCHRHFICCENCLSNGKPFCKIECEINHQNYVSKQSQKVAV